jgi:hypothetical protein
MLRFCAWPTSNCCWRVWSLATAIFLSASTVAPLQATTLTDVSYFTSRPHKLVTFEQRGDGTPTPTSNATLLAANEYSAQGFTFASGLSPGVAWINDSFNTDAAQAIGGSLQLAIGATDNRGDFFIQFSPAATAFGFWVMHTTERSGIPAFDAIGSGGILESAFFSGAAIDGVSGNIAYGFLGIAASQPIYSIHVRGDIALLDNFRFIVVPEPATLALWAMGVVSVWQFSLISQPRCNRDDPGSE